MEVSNKIGDIVLKVTLLIIIVILLIHNCTLMNKKEEEKEPVPNGNATVIELQCNKKDNDCKPTDDNNNNNNNNENNNNNGNNKKNNNNNNTSNNTNNNTNNNEGNQTNNEEEEEELSNEVEVFDKDKDSETWNGSTKLNIFENSMYTKEGTIAPESTNTYKFVVKNGTSTAVKYSLDFSETNSSNINMKYKLKKNGEYIISDYVSYNELDLSNLNLASGANDTYLLEWKWVSSSNDTNIGKNGATYGLQIDVEAESI